MTREEYKLKVLNQIKNRDAGLYLTLKASSKPIKQKDNPYQKRISYLNSEFGLAIEFVRGNDDHINPVYAVTFRNTEEGLESNKFYDEISSELRQDHYIENIELRNNLVLYSHYHFRVSCDKNYDYDVAEFAHTNVGTCQLFLRGTTVRSFRTIKNRWKDMSKMADSYQDFELGEDLGADLKGRLSLLKQDEENKTFEIARLESFYTDCLTVERKSSESTMMGILQRMLNRIATS